MLDMPRTTVTLDEDTLLIVQRRMSEQQVSFKVAINDAIRAGAADRAEQLPYDFPVHDLGPALVDLTKANQIAADLEDEALVEKLRRGA